MPKGGVIIPVSTDTRDFDAGLKRSVDELGRFSKRAENAANGGLRKFEGGMDAGAKASNKFRDGLTGAKTKAEDYGKAVQSVDGKQRKLNEATRDHDKALGPLKGKLDSIKTALTAGGAAATALGAGLAIARREYENLEKVRAEGREGIESTFDGNRRLFQLTDSAEQAEKLRTEADRAAIATSLTRSEARELRFGGESLNFGKDFGDVARAAQLVGIKTAGDVGGAVRQKFSSEDLSAMQAIGGFLVAAESSVADTEGLVQGATKAAGGGKALGANFSETISTLAAFSNATNDPTRSANLLQTFGIKAAQREELKGLGFQGAFKKLQSDEALREDFIKDNLELRVAFDIGASSEFQNDLKKIGNKVRREISSGGSSLTRRVSNFESDAETRALIDEQNAKEANQIAGRTEAIEQMRFDARRAARRAAFTADGAIGGEAIDTPFMVAGGMAGMSPVEAAQFGEQQANRFMGGNGPESTDERLVEMLERIEVNTRPQPDPSPPVVNSIR